MLMPDKRSTFKKNPPWNKKRSWRSPGCSCVFEIWQGGFARAWSGYVKFHNSFKKKTVCLPLSASAVSSPVLSTPTLLNVPKWTSRRRQFRSVKVCVGGCGCSLQCVYGSSLWAGKIFSPDVSQLVDRLCCTGLSWISQRSVLAHFQSEILSPVSQR